MVWLPATVDVARIGEESRLFIPLPDAEVVLMGEAEVRDCAGRVVAVLREAGRSEDTIRRQRVVLERFATFLAGRALDVAGERAAHARHRPRPRTGRYTPRP